MATVTKAIADDIIASDGYFEDDPRVYAVLKYDNAFGGESYALAYSPVDLQRYAPSKYVRNPVILWKAE